jgi:hypothetical protein
MFSSRAEKAIENNLVHRRIFLGVLRDSIGRLERTKNGTERKKNIFPSTGITPRKTVLQKRAVFLKKYAVRIKKKSKK